MMEVYLFIVTIINAIGIFILSIIFHEIGHLLYFKFKLKKNPKLRFDKSKMCFIVGTEQDYQNLEPKQYSTLIESGIGFGSIPILFASAFIHWAYIYIIFAYLIGCRWDIQQLNEVRKELPQEDEDDESLLS